MEEDLFEKSSGEFGIWQAITVTAVYLGRCLSAMQLFAYLIVAAEMPFDCISSNKYNGDQLGKYSSVCEDNCSLFEYDRNIMESTITSDWNLVCGRKWMIDFSQSIFMLGMIIGQSLFGYISDRYGRRMPNFIALAIAIIGAMGVTFGSSYPIFTAFRFISGVGVGGTTIISFVILVEASGNKFRGVICNFYQIPYVLGQMSLAGIGYALNRWRILYFVISIPQVLVIFIFFFVPESPRWLISVGKNEEAEKVMKAIAHRNKLKVDDVGTVVKQLTEAATEKKQTSTKAHFLDLVKTRGLRKKVFPCCFIWFIGSICYFGMQQYISELSRNIFTNILISGLIQLPAPFIATICQKTYGGKKTAMFSSIIGGVCFVLLPLVDDIEWLRLILASVGLLIVFEMFSTLHVYTSELFPTVVRNMAMGLTGTLSRLGGMVAPFVAFTASYVDWIPPLVFGLLSFITAASFVLLPETKGLPLANNLEAVPVPNETSNKEDADAAHQKF